MVMPEIIYHEVGDDGGVSVFDKNVKEIVRDADARLVSPYVGRKYLEELSGLAESWRLVTDFAEMLRLGGWLSGDDGRKFLMSHSGDLRDLKDVHAKAAITDGSAIVGSTNLTEKGVVGRTEIAVRFDGTEEVDRLNSWFGDLWNWDETEELYDNRIESALESASSERRREKTSTSPDKREYRSPPVSKRMVMVGDSENRANSDSEDGYEELVERVSKLPSRGWATGFFELFARLIEFTGMSSDDLRLVSSVPDSRDKIAVTVNHRYVLVAYPRNGEVGVTLPNKDDDIERFFDYDFGTVSGESADDSPYFYVFPEPTDERFVERKEKWREAVTDEMKKATASPYRDSHEPVVYRAAVDSVFRQRLLNDAFE